LAPSAWSWIQTTSPTYLQRRRWRNVLFQMKRKLEKPRHHPRRHPHQSCGGLPKHPSHTLQRSKRRNLLRQLDGDKLELSSCADGNRYSLALDEQEIHTSLTGHTLLSRIPFRVTNNFYALNYASWNGTGWNAQVVQQQISASDTISLALDSNDNPHILYGNDTYYPQSGGYTLTVKLRLGRVPVGASKRAPLT
jgi:hypothetical protein